MKRIIGCESSIWIQCKILRANMFVMMIVKKDYYPPYGTRL